MSRPGVTILDEYEAHIPHRVPESERLQWCDWLRRHSIDPNDVAVPGAIWRNPEARRVAYVAYDRHPHGGVKTVGTPPDVKAKLVEHVVQLEAEPMPFPQNRGEGSRNTPPPTQGH